MSNDLRFAPILTGKTRGKALSPVSASFSVDAGKCLVTVKFSAKLTVKEIAMYAKCLLSNSDFKPTFSEIVDLTQVTEVDLQANDFLKLADKIDPFWSEAKRAFVVRTSLQNHAARMHKILRTDRKIEIFQSMEEAQKWIDD